MSVPVLSAWCSCRKYLHRAVPQFLDIVDFHSPFPFQFWKVSLLVFLSLKKLSSSVCKWSHQSHSLACPAFHFLLGQNQSPAALMLDWKPSQRPWRQTGEWPWESSPPGGSLLSPHSKFFQGVIEIHDANPFSLTKDKLFPIADVNGTFFPLPKCGGKCHFSKKGEIPSNLSVWNPCWAVGSSLRMVWILLSPVLGEKKV